jgi:hypothetical protein
MPPPRIVVAQRCLRDRRRGSFSEALADALPVGVLRFEAIAPRLVIIAKATLEYDEPEEGEGPVAARLSDTHIPLSIGQKSEIYGALEEELAYASDFVPSKAGTDVTLVGHARRLPGAPLLAPGFTRIDVKLALDNWSRQISAVAGGVTDRLPLTGAYVRSVDGVTAARPFGPIARVLPQLRPGEAIDPRHFNAAPPEQRLLHVADDVAIAMEGLSPRAARVAIALPAVAPRVLVDRRLGGRVSLWLQRDTIWIDADARRIALVWRGSIPLLSLNATEVERLVVSLEDVRAPRSNDEILRQLPRGAFFYATEPGDLEAGAEPVPRRDPTLEAARYRTWAHPEAPDPVLPLEDFMALSPALAARGAERERALGQAGLDEYGMLLEQRAWAAQRSKTIALPAANKEKR